MMLIRRRILIQPSNSVAHVGLTYTPLLILRSTSTFSVLNSLLVAERTIVLSKLTTSETQLSIVYPIIYVIG
ncbi:hypothetical protein D3C84_1075250 [compost metagenome]